MQRIAIVDKAGVRKEAFEASLDEAGFMNYRVIQQLHGLRGGGCNCFTVVHIALSSHAIHSSSHGLCCPSINSKAAWTATCRLAVVLWCNQTNGFLPCPVCASLLPCFLNAAMGKGGFPGYIVERCDAPPGAQPAGDAL